MALTYGTLSGALAYHSSNGNPQWSAVNVTDPQRGAALLRGSRWVDFTYRARFSGRKATGRTQEREWPRIGATDASAEAIDEGDVPEEVVSASYEAALRELIKPGSLSPDSDGSPGIKSERKKVGQLEKEIEYQDATSASLKPTFASIDGILSSLLIPLRGNTYVTMLDRF